MCRGVAPDALTNRYVDIMLRGAIYGLTAAGIWGGMYVVSDIVLETIPPFTLLTIRLLLGGINFLNRTQQVILERWPLRLPRKLRQRRRGRQWRKLQRLNGVHGSNSSIRRSDS